MKTRKCVLKRIKAVLGANEDAEVTISVTNNPTYPDILSR
ncbi:MAG: hypothetical protein JWQ40_4308 [Segetibacter sp.]|nr:hypothetical protein [Segetibacter sp.]